MPNNHFDPILLTCKDSKNLNQETFEFYFSKASLNRKEKAKKYLRYEDQCRCLIAEALLQYGLNSIGLSYNLNELSQNKFGKPQFPNSNIQFNLSHSGDWVICAIHTHAIGIDIERIHPFDEGIINHVFTEIEKSEFLLCNDSTSKEELFYTIWALKESYIKCIGQGLSCSLKNFTISNCSKQTTNFHLVKHKQELPDGYFKMYNLERDYKCAVCCESNIFPEVPLILNPDYLKILLEELP